MTLRARLQHAPLLGFFALTFAWSWVCWAQTGDEHLERRVQLVVIRPR